MPMTEMAQSYAREYERVRDTKILIMTQRVRLKHTWWNRRAVSIRLSLMFMTEKKLLKKELQEMQHFRFPTLKFICFHTLQCYANGDLHGTNLWTINYKE